MKREQGEQWRMPIPTLSIMLASAAKDSLPSSMVMPGNKQQSGVARTSPLYVSLSVLAASCVFVTNAILLHFGCHRAVLVGWIASPTCSASK